MRATFPILLTLSFSLSLFAQRPAIEGLPAASWAEAGFNVDSLNAFIPMLDNFQQNDFQGLVVIQSNQAIIEWYYNHTDRTTINDVRSAGKSLTALLLGVAIKEGLVQSLDQDIYSFFSKEKYPGLNEDLQRVSIRHLLDMASGLDADSDDGNSPGHARFWYEKEDWLPYLLSISLKHEPGEKWVYADINAALIGAIIEESSGMSLNEFAKKHVFLPLGIRKYYWHTNEANQTVAAGTLFLSTLDFAKLGILVANAGKWGDQQIVPADYIAELISHKRFDLSNYWRLAEQYGMLWYKNQETINGKPLNYLWASGNGGNHLVVIPARKMVIALTSTAYGYGYGQVRSRAVLNKLLGALE